jgi:hypothetical protein
MGKAGLGSCSRLIQRLKAVKDGSNGNKSIN